MKTFISFFAEFLFFSIISLQVFAQTEIINYGFNESEVFREGEIIPVKTLINLNKPEIDRNLIEKFHTDKNDYLSASKPALKKDHPKFILPVKLQDGLTDDGFYSITGYVDHDTLYPGFVEDYNCGDLSYDLSNGYNHTGTDFFLWPFPWRKMAYDEVEVIAAAPGIILFKQDGNFDQHCEISNDLWNGLCILHEDGSTAWYVHMKKNSLTSKEIGETVQQGEFLGIVGSSGISLAPHLHFEVYSADGQVIDPFFGPCNQSISDSWWLDQLPYKNPGINKICSNSHLPVFSDCPEVEITNESDLFYPGDSIYLMSYLTNLSFHDTLNISIIRPDYSVFDEWIWISPWDYLNTSWLYFFTILKNEQFGNWVYQVKFKGKTYNHTFELKNPNGLSELEQHPFEVYPNPVTDKLFILDIENKIESVEVYSEIGKRLLDFNYRAVSNKTITLDLSGFPKGILIIKLRMGVEQYIEKVVKL